MSTCKHHVKNNNQLCISKVPIFNHLQHDEMLEIVKTSTNKNYKKGEFVFEAGNPSEFLYIVHKGQVKIYRLSESGREQLMRIMRSGDFMGELALFTNESFTSYAEAMEDTEICAIHKSDINKILLAKPAISLKILEVFSNRLNEIETNMERYNSQDAEKRLASYLIELVEKQAAHDAVTGQVEVTLPISKKDLASYIGMTRETLSRRLSTFQDKGWITTSGQRKITIVDYASLAEVGK